MTRLGLFIYYYRLSKWPPRIPYEDLTKFTTWKLQQQIMLQNITITKQLLQQLRSYITIPICCLWSKLKKKLSPNPVKSPPSRGHGLKLERK